MEKEKLSEVEQAIVHKAGEVFHLREAVEMIDQQNVKSREEKRAQLQDRCLAVYKLNKMNNELNEMLKG